MSNVERTYMWAHFLFLTWISLLSAHIATPYTISMIKPDGVQRGLIGEIISRFEKKVNATSNLSPQPRFQDLTDPLFLPFTGIQASGTKALLAFSRTPRGTLRRPLQEGILRRNDHNNDVRPCLLHGLGGPWGGCYWTRGKKSLDVLFFIHGTMRRDVAALWIYWRDRLNEKPSIP